MSTLALKDRLEQAARYLRLLAAGAPAGALLDVRYQPHSPGGLARFFVPVGDRRAAWRIVRLGERTDVYVGCVPRVVRGGTRSDIGRARVLWADCDNPEALRALHSVSVPPPAMIVASGSTGHAHAYWPLARPLDASALERANRMLAIAIGADPKCVNAARILRVPGTHNFKHEPPAPVILVRFKSHIRYDPTELLEALPVRQPPPPSAHQYSAQRPKAPSRQPHDGQSELHAQSPVRRSGRAPSADPLQEIPPVHYVRLLTGRTPDRTGKICCPFHEDQTPSLQAYPTPEQGWTCYGCTTPKGKPLGGDIYTLAARLWNIPAHGRAFLDLRARLDDVFAISRPTSCAEERTRPSYGAQQPFPPPSGPHAARPREPLRVVYDNDIEIDR